jgi:hypothetical protein
MELRSRKIGPDLELHRRIVGGDELCDALGGKFIALEQIGLGVEPIDPRIVVDRDFDPMAAPVVLG